MTGGQNSKKKRKQVLPPLSELQTEPASSKQSNTGVLRISEEYLVLDVARGGNPRNSEEFRGISST